MAFDAVTVQNPPDTSNFRQTIPVERRPLRLYAGFFKRILDVIFVLTTAPIVLTIILGLCPFIMRDGGPLFYTQERVGKNGRVFRMWKLRSMVVDANKRLEAYLAANPERRREWDAHQKLSDDPRVTRVGRFIRKASLDEFPQFWNVLIGDMSMVGPRPMMPDQRALYPGTAYYALRPGITGFWQISVRNKSSFAERSGFDTQYYEQLSFKTDVVVMLRTIRVVLCGTGC